MDGLSEEQKSALEQQKSQCPFCKIIKGDIPSKKVYEDDRIIAILDINPLSTGHSLLLPKEHYPILPMIPRDDFVKLFEVVKDYSFAQKRALVMNGVTVFIANGGVAGQISPHFMVHMIPREKDDGIDIFNLEGKGEIDEGVAKVIENSLPAMVENHLRMHPEKWHTPKDIRQRFTKNQVIGLIEQNHQLKELIMKDPERFIKEAESHQQLKRIFSDVDVYSVVRNFNPDYNVQEAEIGDKKKSEENGNDHAPEKKADAVQKEEAPKQAEQSAKEAEEDKPLTKDEIIDMIKENPKSMELIKKDPEALIKKAEENKELKNLFRGVDLIEIIKHFNPDFRKEKEPDAKDLAELL